jgi:hypothetical protein
MKIRLLTNNRTSRGPGMVYKNLRKGLELLGVKVQDYPIVIDEEFDYCVCLSDPAPWAGTAADSELYFDPHLVGPNMWEIPVESVAAKHQNFLVPSQWVKDLYTTFNFMKDKSLYVWPVGIDTAEWPDTSSNEKIGDCLIYHKATPDSAKDLAIELCLDKGLSCGALTYGSYAEEALHGAVKQCRFAILTTKTESQGIAYQQILASGLPCFVFEKAVWDDRTDGIKCPASAVPYFDERCGVKVREDASREEIYEAFTDFLENLDTFDPRAYIEENLTLEICAQKIVDILEDIDDKKD